MLVRSIWQAFERLMKRLLIFNGQGDVEADIVYHREFLSAWVKTYCRNFLLFCWQSSKFYIVDGLLS